MTILPQIRPFSLLVAGVALVVLLGGAYAFATTSQRQKFSTTTQPAPKNQSLLGSLIAKVSEVGETVSPDQNFPTDPNNRLVFTKNVGSLDNFKPQAWLLNPATEETTPLELPEFSTVLKQPTSDLVFFVNQNNEDGSFMVKNLNTGETTTYAPFTHPNPAILEHLSIYELNSIAPDGSAVVYQIEFYQKCPDVDVPEGFQGGFGPCMPDPDPNLPMGYYLYDLKTKQTTYLTDMFLPARWDMASRQLYYVDHGANQPQARLVRLDLQSKATQTIDTATTFGYGAFPFFDQAELVVISGQTGDTGTSSLSQIALVDTKSGTTIQVIDSGKWADIQPFASIAPDEKTFLYQRSPLYNGLMTSTLHLYDRDTKQVKQLTPSSNEVSYSIRGVWIDNHTYVTLVDTIESGPGQMYRNDNNYLVKIDTDTGTITRLTSQNDVLRFNPSQ